MLLDKEAFKRGTSVYLVDRVIPMLPEKLSNDLCSLKPLEDKLTFSAVFELDEQANIKNEWFGKTIIHSNRRFTYDEVQAIIESHPESEKRRTRKRSNSPIHPFTYSPIREGIVVGRGWGGLYRK